MLTYGMITTETVEWDRLLEERYLIRRHRVAGCIVSETLTTYVDSYNKVMLATASRRFGRDVYRESREQATSVLRNYSDRVP